jgi:patatin-like phospholipase/acyl hydrolase
VPDFPGTKVIDAVMASAGLFSAARRARAPGVNAFVDGGVFANNPSTAAFAALIGSRIY